MHVSAQTLRDRLRGSLIAAAATPMTADREVDLDLVSRYLAGLVADGAGALAVLAHTGRGPFLPPEVRAGVIERAVALGVPVLVGVGGHPDAGGPGGSDAEGGSPAGDGVARTSAEARVAADLGAAGVLVFPSAGDRPALHDAVWRASRLPMIAFDLYTRPCPPAVLAEILAHPGVAGLKTALLSDAMGCQRAIALTREAGRLAITGEDRMFGPSLLWGAEAALVGIAAAAVEVGAAVLDAFRGDDLRAFEEASGRLDRLAQATFTEPMEGYVQRMLWLAAAEGRIPASHAHDPYGPPLPAEERAEVVRHRGRARGGVAAEQAE
ncbi:dihydrodipicolinate synthase family protein [Microbispora sp. NPDC046933]|uniref:dihydrodipicolinate synthase family protein n=1 Tax=Microbispora sp. NPDC046933 TaxID=3155618 RepID=UPI0033F17CBB